MKCISLVLTVLCCQLVIAQDSTGSVNTDSLSAPKRIVTRYYVTECFGLVQRDSVEQASRTVTRFTHQKMKINQISSRGIPSAALALNSGVYGRDNQVISIIGSRADAIAYYLDGVRIITVIDIPEIRTP